MKFGLKLILFSLLYLLVNRSIAQVPSEKLTPYKLFGKFLFKGDSIIIRTRNSLECPIHFEITFQNQSIQKQIVDISSITLQKGEPIEYIVICNDSIPCREKPIYKITTKYGDIKKEIKQENYSLPFPKKFITRVMQGYNGSFSHRSNIANTYAIDFKMLMNDTICATADGFVVGMIDGYFKGGNRIELQDYANKITLFHPKANTFSEYYHLNTNGSFVQIGDFVIQGQAIGLAGNTGYSSESHLHFEIVVSAESNLGCKSIPIRFIEGYDGRNLKSGSIVVKN